MYIDYVWGTTKYIIIWKSADTAVLKEKLCIYIQGDNINEKTLLLLKFKLFKNTRVNRIS